MSWDAARAQRSAKVGYTRYNYPKMLKQDWNVNYFFVVSEIHTVNHNYTLKQNYTLNQNYTL